MRTISLLRTAAATAAAAIISMAVQGYKISMESIVEKADTIE